MVIFVFTPDQRKDWEDFYEDVAVLAFPTPEGNETIGDADEKVSLWQTSL